MAGLPEFTVSIGLVEADPHEELPAMMARADAALFQAKRDGHDRVVIWVSTKAVRAGSRAELRSTTRYARSYGSRSSAPSSRRRPLIGGGLDCKQGYALNSQLC